MRHSTRVVREKEALRPARFESEEAKNAFEAGVHELQANKESSTPEVFAVPLLCWYSRVNELSDNAIYNDQVSVCDTDGDNFITLPEALAYRAKVAEKMTFARKGKVVDLSAAAK